MITPIGLFIGALITCTPAFAIGSIIAAAIGLSGFWATAAAFAINTIVSSIVSKALMSPAENPAAGQSPNPGNRQQVPPATDNKLPVVYGQAWLGGIITDLSITTDNLEMYYVITLCETTGTGSDVITFGDVYWGGKRVVFNSNGYSVDSLYDPSTSQSDTSVKGKMDIYLYKNGSYSPANSSTNAVSVMSASNLTYQWNSSKLMSNCAFAIVHIKYSIKANLRGIEPTKFQLTNSRSAPGDCVYDYLTNTRYGAAIPVSQIDTQSLTDLNTYSNANFTYTTYSGGTSVQTRFRFDGAIDTSRTIMQNLQDMMSSCDSLLRYDEVTATWGVIVQQPTYTVAMALDDSSLVGPIEITPTDLSSSFNVAEVKFPDKSNQDAFNSVSYDLSVIDPALLYPNEPVNKQSISLPLVNDNVRAQYIANRLMKGAREDLSIRCSTSYIGIQLEAGDIVSVTNANYGWSAKLFRINKVTQTFSQDGSIVCQLFMTEFNPDVYSDTSITQFTPAPNSGLGDPSTFGTLAVPVLASQYPTAANPSFTINVTTAPNGITQYVELYYSAFTNPTNSQLIFAGTTAVQPDGFPYAPNTVLPITLTNVPSGDWYFFSQMVNNLGASPYSSASSLFRWRPSTYQFTNRYLAIAYADTITGSGFSLSPRGKIYYGLCNQDSISPPTSPSSYTWYLADPNFGTSYYLCYSNRTGRKFSFATGLASATAGAFVPTNTSQFDPSIWSALVDGTNYIDLDSRTGQLIEYGGTVTGTQSGEVSVINNPDGKVIASLSPLLATQFGPGVYSVTSSAATITIDVYGRVIGFTVPDSFYYTQQVFTATSGQTVFTVTRGAGYIVGNCLVFENGLLLNPSEYTDASGSVTFATGRTLNDIITIVSVKAVNASTGVYSAFTRNTANLTDASSYTASGFTLNSGFELLFLNGTVVNDQDYDIIGQTITNFPDLVTGDLEIIQWTANNQSQPCSGAVNSVAYTINGQSTYNFSYNASSFNLYSNGALLKQGTDYTTATGNYTLASTPTTNTTVMVQQTFARTGAV
jgi:hypothetical protein